MINRGDIKLAIDMVVNAQDDSLFGGEAEYVINTLEDCGNTIAAQAAVIEKLREAVRKAAYMVRENTLTPGGNPWALQEIEAMASPTDSTQILDEVRRAERERCIYVINAQKNPIQTSYANGLVFDPANNMVDKCACAIRAME